MLQIKIIYVQKRDGKNDKIVNFINFLFFYHEDKCIFNVLVFLKKNIFSFFYILFWEKNIMFYSLHFEYLSLYTWSL
jgi:hypothetical protein